MMRRRGARYPRVTVSRRDYVTPRQLHNEAYGYRPRGRFDPPAIVANPWNSLVVAFESGSPNAGVTETTVGSIALGLRSQLGLPDFEVDMRFRRVDVWSGSSSTDYDTNMALRPAPLLAGLGLTWIEDRGTLARPAHMHWVWSAAETRVVYSSIANKDNVIYFVDHRIGAAWTQHINLLWKPHSGDPIPTYRLHASDSERAVDQAESVSVESSDFVIDMS